MKLHAACLKLKKNIDHLKKLLDSTNIYLVSCYKSRNAEFRTLPPKLLISLPSFMPSEINKQLICQQIDSLSAPSIEPIERKYRMKCMTSTISRPQNKKSTLKKKELQTKTKSTYQHSKPSRCLFGWHACNECIPKYPRNKYRI